MHHPLARRSSQEYIRRPKSAQGILKCPSPLSLHSIEAEFPFPRHSQLSPLVDHQYFSGEPIIRSHSVSTASFRPRRHTTSSSISTTSQQLLTNQTRQLQSAFRSRSMSTQANMYGHVTEREPLGPRTSCPGPSNVKFRTHHSLVGTPLLPQFKHSVVSLSDTDLSLLLSRTNSQKKAEKPDVMKVYSLKVKRWLTVQAEGLKATMAPKTLPFSYFMCYNYVEIPWYSDSSYTRSADKCRGCEGDFFQQEPCLLHDNRLWHYTCLRCNHCNHPIQPYTPYLCPSFNTENRLCDTKPILSGTQSLGRKRNFSSSTEYWKGFNYIICGRCVPICKTCIRPVLNNHVMALGTHWHQDCFRCSTCGELLGKNNKVYGKKGEVSCSRCITPLFENALSNPKLLRSALSIDSDEIETPLDDTDITAKFNNRMCRENSLLFSSVTEMASAFAYALSEHTEKNEEISLPDTHRNYSENLNAFLTFNSLDRRHLKEKKKQKRQIGSFTGSLKCERGVASPIVNPSVPISLSSYKTIINSHEGRALLIDYCIENCEIEKIYFISDVECLKEYDNEELDWAVLVRKLYKLYIDIESRPELLISLPKDIVEGIKEKIKAENCPIDIFDKARDFVLNQVEKNIVNHFLKSSYGSQYLKALVSFDNVSRQVIRSISKNVSKLEIELTVLGFDKRYDTHMPKGKSKYYVYEIQVKIGEYEFTIFRRYKEFYNLNETLKKEFVRQLPQFPHKLYFRKSEVKSIAKQRSADLDDYLQELLTKPPEISKHQELLTFIKQTETDVKDEEFNKFLTLRGVRRAN